MTDRLGTIKQRVNDTNWRWFGTHPDGEADVRWLIAEVERLQSRDFPAGSGPTPEGDPRTEVLRKYGRHTALCSAAEPVYGKCTCGFEEALASLAPCSRGEVPRGATTQPAGDGQ